MRQWCPPQTALRSCGKRHLMLVNNLSLTLALTKGRGSSYIANRTFQQLCALSLASDCKFLVRWIPSERNCADRPSRSFGISRGCGRPSDSSDGRGGSHLATTSREPLGCPSTCGNKDGAVPGEGADKADARASPDCCHPGRGPVAPGAAQSETHLNPGKVPACVDSIHAVVRCRCATTGMRCSPRT